MKWLTSIIAFVAGRASSDLAVAIGLVKTALPVVRQVAALTPTRADDELIRLFDQYAVPGVEAWLSLPTAQRGRALMHVAATQLKRVVPDRIDRIIDLAVQLAVVESRQAK